jgi:hypothetical protein
MLTLICLQEALTIHNLPEYMNILMLPFPYHAHERVGLSVAFSKLYGMGNAQCWVSHKSRTIGNTGAHGSIVGWGWKVADSIPDVIGFFNWPNPSSHTMALGSTQPLTEMSTRILPGGKGWLAREAENLTTMWDPRHFTAFYMDSFTFFFFTFTIGNSGVLRQLLQTMLSICIIHNDMFVR